jgi:hypothetical protein
MMRKRDGMAGRINWGSGRFKCGPRERRCMKIRNKRKEGSKSAGVYDKGLLEKGRRAADESLLPRVLQRATWVELLGTLGKRSTQPDHSACQSPVLVGGQPGLDPVVAGL